MSVPSRNETLRISKTGNIEDIKLLLSNGADKSTVLFNVCLHGHLDVLKCLVEECGLDPLVENYYAL